MLATNAWKLMTYGLCTTATTEILLDMVTRMSDHKMGLVHQLPFTTDQLGFAAAVEKVHTLSCCVICRIYINYIAPGHVNIILDTMLASSMMT